MKRQIPVNKCVMGKNSGDVSVVDGGFVCNYGGAVAVGYKAGNKEYSLSVPTDDLKAFLSEIGKDKRPEIVCLCGSTRYFKTFDEQNFKLTLEGKIVLSIGCNTKSDEGLKLTVEDKIKLDELHKRKIDLCDYILVLNVDGYIGDSTRSEIAYAEKIGKPIKYLY
jgi:hypothetical protein